MLVGSLLRRDSSFIARIGTKRWRMRRIGMLLGERYQDVDALWVIIFVEWAVIYCFIPLIWSWICSALVKST